MLTTPLMTNQTIQLCITHKCVNEDTVHSRCIWIGTPRVVLLQTEPGPFQDQSPPNMNSIMYLYFQKRVGHLLLTALYSGILRIRIVSNVEDSGILLSLPDSSPPHIYPHTPSFVSLSCLAVIDILLNYEKVEGALVRHRGIFITVCAPRAPSYISE